MAGLDNFLVFVFPKSGTIPLKSEFLCIPSWVLENLKSRLKRATKRRIEVNSFTATEIPTASFFSRMRFEDRLGHVAPLKIAVLGARKVGKSALTVRFLTKRFIGDYRSDTGKKKCHFPLFFLKVFTFLSRVSTFSF